MVCYGFWLVSLSVSSLCPVTLWVGQPAAPTLQTPLLCLREASGDSQCSEEGTPAPYPTWRKVALSRTRGKLRSPVCKQVEVPKQRDMNCGRFRLFTIWQRGALHFENVVNEAITRKRLDLDVQSDARLITGAPSIIKHRKYVNVIVRTWRSGALLSAYSLELCSFTAQKHTEAGRNLV